MDATCNVQDSIHVFHLVHNMCPGFWVHIKRLQASFYIRFIYSWSYIIIGDEKGGDDGDEDVSNQSYFVKKKNDRISV